MSSYSTKIYLYHQRHRVILVDINDGDIHARRYNKVYSKKLIASKGTDSTILIDFQNQDQKRVDILGREFMFRLISADGKKLLLEKALVIINASAGQTKIVLTEQELDPIKAGDIGYSIEQVKRTTFSLIDGIEETEIHEPIYVDDNAGGRGIIEISDSIMPSFVDSNHISIPSHNSLLPSYDSSVLWTEDYASHTFQVNMNDYTGNITLNGAADMDGQWYTIPTTLPDEIVDAKTHIFTVAGYHGYLRFTFTDSGNNIGEVIDILNR